MAEEVPLFFNDNEMVDTLKLYPVDGDTFTSTDLASANAPPAEVETPEKVASVEELAPSAGQLPVLVPFQTVNAPPEV